MGGKAKIEKTFLKVHCPCCGNGRLFDIGLEAKGTVRIKCPVCRNPVEIHFVRYSCNKQSNVSVDSHHSFPIEFQQDF